MFPVPIVFPIPTVVNEGLQDRVLRLEGALAMSLGMLQILMARMEEKLGPGFLGEELAPLIGPSGIDARKEVAGIDALIKAGEEPKATRVFRELTGATWDDAHRIIGLWEEYRFDQKVRWLQLSDWIKVLHEVVEKPKG